MGGRRVLLVDEDEAALATLAASLEATGRFTVRAETDPALVRDAARRFRPEALVVAAVMSGRDGGSVVEEVRRLRGLDAVPVVFMNSLIDTKVSSLFWGCGPHAAVAKPVTGRSLAACLDDVLKARDEGDGGR